jgi:SAM-dependent methyltransferase
MPKILIIFSHFSSSESSMIVKKVFSNVSTSYDVMNDLMSGGIHRLWKDRFISTLSPGPQTKLLDVAGGTGDIAFRFLDAANNAPMYGERPAPHVTILDINPSMLEVGKQRAKERRLDSGTHLLSSFFLLSSNPIANPCHSLIFLLAQTRSLGWREMQRNSQLLQIQWTPTPLHLAFATALTLTES